MYIQVCEDGGAILKKDSPYEGIITYGVNTCIAIIAKGNDGVLLIHDTGQLSVASIDNLAATFGSISDYSIAYRDHPSLSDEFSVFYDKERIRLVRSIFESRLAKYSELTLCEGGYVSVTKDYNINNTSARKFYDSHEVECLTTDRDRLLINKVNNAFININEQCIPVDIHYDGHNRLPPPTLLKTLDEMTDIVKSTKNNYKREWLCNLLSDLVTKAQASGDKKLKYTAEKYSKKVRC